MVIVLPYGADDWGDDECGTPSPRKDKNENEIDICGRYIICVILGIIIGVNY
tara:strand:+ start:87 stop:242 length:156 start_codon:yes stop_codon:yes gene_type:complete